MILLSSSFWLTSALVSSINTISSAKNIYHGASFVVYLIWYCVGSLIHNQGKQVGAQSFHASDDSSYMLFIVCVYIFNMRFFPSYYFIIHHIYKFLSFVINFHQSALRGLQHSCRFNSYKSKLFLSHFCHIRTSLLYHSFSLLHHTAHEI